MAMSRLFGSCSYSVNSKNLDSPIVKNVVELTGPNGTFVSPNHPSAYPHNVEYIWIIKLQDKQLRVHIYFEVFNTHGEGDTVEVLDGSTLTSPLLLKQYGLVSTKISYLSTNSTMFVRFKTDGLGNASGFRAYYEETDGKLEKRPSHNDGIIYSPSFPNSYPNFLEYVWILRPLSQTYLTQLTFKTFNLGEGDTVEVRDGETESSPLLGEYLATDLLPPSLIGTSSLYVKLIVKSINASGTGVVASFQPIVPLVQSIGTIYYPAGVNAWVISASRSTETFHFVFQDFRTLPADFVEIRDGGYPNSTLLGNYSGNYEPQSVPGPFYSSSSKMFIRIRSFGNGSDPHPGSSFRVTYVPSVIHDNDIPVLPTTGVTIRSSHYPQNYTNSFKQSGTLHGISTQRLLLMVPQLDTEKDVDTLALCDSFLCPSGGMQVNLSGKAGTTEYQPYYILENGGYFEFNSNERNTGKGFVLNAQS